jgi:cell fate regulator YaaT (PSP1 superfamily)
MTTIAGVRFHRADRVHYYTADADLAVGDPVVAETERGPEVGWVVIAPDQVLTNELPEPPRAIVRKAQPEDLRREPCSRPPEAATFERVGACVRQAGLPLRLDSAPPGSAPPASAPVEPVPVAVPRDDWSGLERLLACLSEANRQYLEAKHRLPRLGQIVGTPNGPGQVIEVKVLREQVTVRLGDGSIVALAGSPLVRVEPQPDDTRGGVRGGRSRRKGRSRLGGSGGAPPPTTD